MRHRPFFAAAYASLALAGCAALTLPAAPVTVADATLLDEQGAIAVESTYRALGLVLEAAVDAGALTGAAAAHAAALEDRAFSAVRATRAAYGAGNAPNYLAAQTEARRALAAALLAVNGE